MLESLFNKACNFIKKRLQQSCFPVNIAMIFREHFFLKCVICILSTRHLLCFKFYLRERNIYEDTFLLVTSILFEMLEFNPLYYKKKDKQKYHLIFFFCNFINNEM